MTTRDPERERQADHAFIVDLVAACRRIACARVAKDPGEEAAAVAALDELLARVDWEEEP
jgi:hypothetical protein